MPFRRRPPSGEDGFTLVEVLVAMAVIGTVMAGAAPFLTKSLAVVNQQRVTQIAVQVANDALERVRALDPSSLSTGRSATAIAAQKAAAPAKVLAYLNTMDLAADPMLPSISTAGITAPLPTEAVPIISNGTTFQQQWYVGKCNQSQATIALPIVSSCKSAGLLSVGLPFFKVVVSVTWPDKFCTGGTCVYVATTLVSIGNDPVFDTKTAAPTVTDPVAQKSYVGELAGLQVLSSGGKLPLTWTATGLPPGLTMTSAALISGTPTTAGSYTVTVTVTDAQSRTDDSTFAWTVAAAPAITNPGAQTTRTSTAVSFQPVVTGGVAPLTWTATGLPTGLSINATTGLITGTTSTTTQTTAVILTATDSGTIPKTVTATFSWRILTPVALINPNTQTVNNGTNIGSFTALASGGLTPYTWSTTNLPDGLVLNTSSGAITGTITHGTRYLTTVTVTDAAGGSASMVVPVVVNPNPAATDLRVTTPAPASPNQSTTALATVSLQAAASGATPASYVWTATGLPTGLTISTSGLISGKPTTKGTYTVLLTVKSTGTTQSNLMFVWTVA
ncbi:type II secretion system protein [Winogradskya humida]|uniref:Prepilin-type N-terminal cleavage/methylation domain-containing protein n=1 Tax=Winogradskya humida TaxID=113566 RepID=A0ABQ4A336_9ACTN|nr:type II secretion system protein [Actinoplanes humidus]GIE25270.1 hypothetical protein Ahu01nite_083720 [Actinoplanes humidus]